MLFVFFSAIAYYVSAVVQSDEYGRGSSTDDSLRRVRVSSRGRTMLHASLGKWSVFYHFPDHAPFEFQMMQNLLLNENDLVQIEYTSLPTATYVKFKPQSTDFLEISNHRAV